MFDAPVHKFLQMMHGPMFVSICNLEAAKDFQEIQRVVIANLSETSGLN